MRKGVYLLTTGFIINAICLSANAGESYRDKATVLKDKITEVVVYSDRAKIIRKGVAKKIKGNSWLVFRGLPYSLDKNTLIVRAIDKKLELEQIIVEDSFEHVSIGEELSKITSRLEYLYATRLDKGQGLFVLLGTHNFLRNLSFSAPFSKNGYNYKGFRASLNIINTAFEEIRKSSNRYNLSIEKLNGEIKEIDREIEFLRKKIRGVTNLSKQKWLTNVYVKVNLKKKRDLKLFLSYMIGKALWRPVYDIRAELNNQLGVADINIVTAGLIEQHTGEFWEDISVTLSSMSPDPLYLPRLSRWVFEETRVTAVAASRGRGIFANKSMSAPRKMMEKENYKGRKSNRMMKDMVSPLVGGMKESLDMESTAVAAGSSFNRLEKKKSRRSRKKEYVPSVAPREFKQDKNYAVASDSKNSANLFPLINVRRIYPELNKVLNKIDRMKNSAMKQREYNPTRGQTSYRTINYQDSTLPAVQAHGRLIELKSPFKLSLKNDEPPMKIPLKASKFKGNLKYYAIPKVDKLVYLKAQVINTTDTPILMGKTQIFMNGDLVSRSKISTISENQFFEINLGVDQNIETKRIVNRKSEQKGVVFKDQITKVDVVIEVVNHHNFPINIIVKDNYPTSPRSSKVKVTMLDIMPKTKEKYHGVISWEEKIAKKGKKKFSFSYSVKHPSNFLVSEFN